MRAPDLDQLVLDAAEEVLETMFFATVMGNAAAAPAGEGSLAARVLFRGRRSGAVTVAVCPEAARGLTAAFLALDEDEVSGEHAREVIGELANMICGSILGRLHPDLIFELLHPEPVAFPASPAGTAAHKAFDIGAGTLSVAVELQS